uniref:FAD-binding domain-containing protein n=1 Tax=Pseudictyota dubia TaxID=2749911 RepID=A0A7R9Z1H9_9STRA
MAATSTPNHFVIIGAGPVGLLAALALRKHCPAAATKISIYERRPNLEQSLEESYPIGVSPRGLRALKEISPAAFEQVQTTGALVNSWDIYGGNRQVAQVQSGTTLGHTRFSVMDALYQQVEKTSPAIDVHFGTKLTALDIKHQSLTLMEESTHKETKVDCSHALVIACDGANSTTRRLLVGNCDAQQDPSYTPTRHVTTPWGIYFRVLFMDSVEDPMTVPLDPNSHSIYNGCYCAITGPSNGQRKWIVALASKKYDDHGDWFFVDSKEPTSEQMTTLRQFIADRIPPLAPDTAQYFSDDEIKAFFTRRQFTGNLVSLAPLHYPHNFHAEAKQSASTNPPWLLFLGDSAHSVFPATGEGLNSGLDDVLQFAKTVLTPASSSSGTMDIAAFTASRQTDVDALANLANEILSASNGPPQVRVTNLITLIVSSMARKVGILGPSEAELRYGPQTSLTNLMAYRDVWKRHVADTKWIRKVAGIMVSIGFSIFSWIPTSSRSTQGRKE